MRILHIISSPRRTGASVAVTSAIVDALRAAHPDAEVDTLDVWVEELPEFDGRAIGAKYKGVSGEEMDDEEARIWGRIQELGGRIRSADRIVLGVPMWNWSIPYKLKQLIDLAAQRDLLFTFDGTRFGPAVEVARADVVLVRGQHYDEDGPTPASVFDHQSAYVEFFLRTIGVRDVRTLVVERTWEPGAEDAVAAARRRAGEFALAD